MTATVASLNFGSSTVDHWAGDRKTSRAAKAALVGKAWIDHFAPAQPAAAAAPVARAAAATVTPVDAVGAYQRAYRRAVGEELTLGEWISARWSALRQRREQARVEAEMRSLAQHDVRVLRDLQVARDLAEWH